MPSLTFALSYPLPPECAPERVVAALQRYVPLITPNPFMVSYSRRPVVLAEIVDDPFFRDDGQALAAFEVIDRIVVVPGLAKKQVVIPCVMQRFEGGVRCRSFAAGGVKVWSTWRVLPASEAARGAEAQTARSSSDDARRLSLSNRRRQREATSTLTAPTAPTEPTAAPSQGPTPPATPPAPHAAAPAPMPSFPPLAEGYALVEDARVECSTLVKPFVSRSFREAHLEILRKVVKDVVTEPERERMTYHYM